MVAWRLFRVVAVLSVSVLPPWDARKSSLQKKATARWLGTNCMFDVERCIVKCQRAGPGPRW